MTKKVVPTYIRAFVCIIILMLMADAVKSQSQGKLYLDQFCTYEHIAGEKGQDTVFVTCAVFRQGEGHIVADTAFWIKGNKIILIGHVIIWDTLYNLQADHVDYDLTSRLAYATGRQVMLTSETDSIRAIGRNAYYSRDSSILRMSDRPMVFLNYPDSSRQIQIIADFITLNSNDGIAYADGKTVINREETGTESERAIMYLNDDVLLLLGQPVARRRQSEITGDTLILVGDNSSLSQLKVYGNSRGSFKEPSPDDSTLFDYSDLTAKEMEFNLAVGELDNIVASGQAFSYYNPASSDSGKILNNNVSGDTIKMYLEEERLRFVEVLGGAEGEYLTGGYKMKDTVRSFSQDTVKYTSDYIGYSLLDSSIALKQNAQVSNKSVSLSAYRIKYNTVDRTLVAYNYKPDDSLSAEVPVILRDGSEEMTGSYLEYSMLTEKGMIRHSRSDQDLDHYTGGELLREEDDVYYVEDGTYCSCEYDDANYLFRAKKMKMIRGDKLIAKPVVFYIEKIPLFIIPYYVFPMKPDRHSGFLSFQVGNFERGERYISNVGYYWAASEYWDILGAFDYYENYGFNYRSSVRYSWRYRLSGSFSGSFADVSQWSNYKVLKKKRWDFNFSHSQTLSPTASLRASGNFISDKSYYTDYSTDLADRLNRNIKSQISLSKRFGSASLSAQVVHNVMLDAETRIDNIPTASLSFPSKPIFGTPKKDDDGQINRKWYHNFYYKYGTSLNNYSYRKTDSTGFKSRKEFATINHSSSLSATFSAFNYFRFNPSFSYQETWYSINKTDQSLAAGIDASETYRRWAYSGGISASTDLYGTVYPNLFGLEGLRHVLSPRISFSWAPEITRHDNIRKYTGAGGGGAKSKYMSFSLSQLFQTKIKKGEQSRKIDLLSITSSFGYNFEAEGKKFSTLSTSAHTSLLKNISLSANMTHDFYKPNSEELSFWSPYLLNFSISTSFHTKGIIGGKKNGPDENDPLILPSGGKGRSGTDKSSWSFSLSHHYSESGREASFYKSHYLSLSGSLSLTATLDISYSQSYDVVRKVTTSRRIEVRKKLHCWEGYFTWVPDGSNRGYYFRINIITIPDIKFEQTESGTIREYF